jgi:hypothetical protein
MAKRKQCANEGCRKLAKPKGTYCSGVCRQRAYRLRKGAEPTWTRPEAPHLLADVNADDAHENLRTVVLRWTEQAAHIEELLEEGREFQFRYPEDAAAIKLRTREVEQLCRRLRKVKGSVKPYDPYDP